MAGWGAGARGIRGPEAARPAGAGASSARRTGGARPITIATTTTGAGVTAPRVGVADGHSAGHIEPTMNFADALRRLEPAAEITALGTVRGLDTTLIPARGYPLELIPPVPLPRKLNRALVGSAATHRIPALADLGRVNIMGIATAPRRYRHVRLHDRHQPPARGTRRRAGERQAGPAPGAARKTAGASR
jgi:Glycosyltransferase family 28 N-terminal domain